MIFKKIATLVSRVMVSDKQKKLLSASKKAASLQRAGKKTNHGDHKLDGGIGGGLFGSQVRL